MNRLNIVYFLLASIISTSNAFAQESNMDPEILRGSITSQRLWWDLDYYHLQLSVNPEDSTIDGMNTIQYKVLDPQQVMQIDLQPPLKIAKIEQDGESLSYDRIGNAYFIRLAKNQIPGALEQVKVYYGGRPHIALRAPWDGGFSFKKDKSGHDFIATSCQGIGASIWYPCKDHLYDEPDSVLLSITVPEHLQNISNGRLRSIEDGNGTKTFNWFCE